MNNDFSVIIDLNVNYCMWIIDLCVKSINNIDSSVNSTNSDIQNIEDVSTASETKIVDIDLTTDQSSSGYVSKLTWFRFLDLDILSAVVSSLCCCSTHAIKHHSQGKKD